MRALPSNEYNQEAIPKQMRSAIWKAFCRWADRHAVPDMPEEEWLYLWECWQSAAVVSIDMTTNHFQATIEELY
jgi:hypothetical protein